MSLNPQNPEIVFEKPYVKLFIDRAIPAIYEDWTGCVSGEEFHEALEVKLKIYNEYKKRYPTLKWLNDIRKLRGIDNDDQAWATQEFHPKLYQSGITKVAFIVPENAYYRLSDKQMAGTFDHRGEVMIGYFDTFKSASSWLRVN